MRIIHTADWHLCDRLGRLDRTADLQARVGRIAELCEEHRADLLLVAGDVFSEQADVQDMTAALDYIRRTFTPFFARGGTLLAVTGNHDRDIRVNIVRSGMMLAAPVAGDGPHAAGRAYFVNGRGLVRFASPLGHAVQFVVVPYPLPSRYELSAKDYRSKEEQSRLLQDILRTWLAAVPRLPGYDVTLPTVLAAHLHVRGSELTTAYKMTDRDDVLFQFADLNVSWAYIALGHIHKPQMLGGAAHVRYPGSLDRLDFGETHDGHGVLLFDVGPAGLLADPVHLPIPATPFHTIDLADPEAELSGLAAKYPDHATAIVRIRAAAPAAGAGKDELTRELRKLFPRIHELTWTAAGADADAETAATTLNPDAGFEATVRDYLAAKLAGVPDGEHVLALAEHFLTPQGRP